MELIRGLHNLREKHRGCVATIGNFDGVHLGHRQVLAQVKAKARELNLPSVVITFEPQPQEFFTGDKAPPRLTRFSEKYRLLQAEGIDRHLCLNFNDRLRAMTAEQFVQELLLHGLAVKHFVVGDDFRFGCDRTGDYNMLCDAGERHDFTVVNTQTFLSAEERVSSTRIRSVLQQNNLETAAALLGRPYTVSGRVMHGQKLGRQLGVPTANVRMHRYACPLRGVYAVEVKGPDFSAQGVCNVGVRPTVCGQQPVLEAHLFDFDKDIYGQLLTVEFKQFVRDERKFSDIDALKQQIFADIEDVRTYFDRTRS